MKLRDVIVCALAASVLGGGCGKKDEGTKAAKAGSQAAGTQAGSQAAGAQAGSQAAGAQAGSQAAGGDAEAPLPPVVPVDQAAVQKVVDAWLAAQNAGDFAAYQALYADKMEGVKRVGARTWRFDRKGWLADRERMFKNKMTVAAKDVAVSGSVEAPVVELTQTFQQGKFSDQGTKRLVLARAAGGLRIAREEMLRSVVAGAMAGKAAGQTWLGLELDGKQWAVLDNQASDAWGDGKVRGPFDASNYHYAMRGAAKAPSAASWAARELAVYDATGKRCTARVGALALVGGGTPHFGTVQMWDGEDGEPKWTKAQRARAIYEMSDPKLVGELAIEGGCAPVLVVDAAAKPVVYGSADADDATTKAATAAFRKLAAYKSIQEDFASAEDGGTGPWVANPAVAVFTDGTRKLVVVSAREGAGCGGFFGALTAVYEDKAGKLTLLSAPDQGYLGVTAIVDLEGDGQVELIGVPDDFSTATALFVGGAAGFNPLQTVEFPFNDCGC